MVGGRDDPGAHRTLLPLDSELAVRGRVKASAPVVFPRELNQTTQHWHTGSVRPRVVPAYLGGQVYESHVD